MASAKPNYAPPTMPTFCNDWLTSRSVAALPVAGEALFMRLLLAQWQSGPLPDDIDQIMAFAGYRPEFKDAWPKVRALFQITPDGLVNARLEEIRSRWVFHASHASANCSLAAWVAAMSVNTAARPAASANASSASMGISHSSMWSSRGCVMTILHFWKSARWPKVCSTPSA